MRALSSFQERQPVLCLGKQALLEAFVACRQSLVEMAAHIVGSRGAAEDTVHDTLIRILESPLKGCIRQPAGYLFRMVRNRAIDCSRRAIVHSRYAHMEEAVAEDSAAGESPEAALAHRETLDRLEHALSALPPRTRTAFEMHRLSGYSQKDVARLMGVSPTLVNFMVRDAHNYCREILNRCELAGERSG